MSEDSTQNSALAGRHPGARTCPRCGAQFVCGMEAGVRRCWCADLPPVKLPEAATDGCYCPDCLRKLLENSPCSP